MKHHGRSFALSILYFADQVRVPKRVCADGEIWSTGRELNPRILVLQTNALATSPPVLLSRAHESSCQQSSGYCGPAALHYQPLNLITLD